MIPCITIGDSIAVGVGQVRPECEIVARVGITSGRYVATMLPPGRTSAGTAVISLGVNDGDTANTLDNLRLVRSRIEAGTVVWLLPGLKPEVREMIHLVAEENGDRTLDTRPEVGRDHLHPTRAGYRRLADSAIGGTAPADTGPTDTGPTDTGIEVADAPEEPRGRAHRTTAHHTKSHHTRTSHAGTQHASTPYASTRHGHASHARTAGKATPHAATRVTAKAACTNRHCHPGTLRS